jgi:lipid-binding SYLF domain-containing protein
LAPLLIGAVFLVLTGLYENFTFSPYNIFPHSVMKNYRGFSIVTGVGFLIGMLYYSTLILWPIQIQTFYATDSVQIGLYGMSWGWGSMIGALVMGFIVEKINHARLMLTLSALLMTVFIGTQAIVGMLHLGWWCNILCR